MNDDLRDRLDAVEQAAGIGAPATGGTVVYIGSTDDVPPDLRLTRTLDDPADPVDAVTRTALPNIRPVGYRGGVTALDTEDVITLWKTMPEDARELERKIRREQGDPIPPILSTGEAGGDR